MPCNTSAIVKVPHSVVIAVEVSKRKLQKHCDPHTVSWSRPTDLVQSASDYCFNGTQLRFYGLESFPTHFSHHNSVAFAQLSLFLSSVFSSFVQWSRCKHNIRLIEPEPRCPCKTAARLLAEDWVPTASSALNIVFFGPRPLEAFPAHSK